MRTGTIEGWIGSRESPASVYPALCGLDMASSVARLLARWPEDTSVPQDMGRGITAHCKLFSPSLEPPDRLECHRAFIDVHVVIEGEELYRVEDSGSLRSLGEYGVPDDVEWFGSGTGRDILMLPGSWLMIEPGEAHMGGFRRPRIHPEPVSRDAGRLIRKVVFKVPAR